MALFELGAHVIVQLNDTRSIAGYLLENEDRGVTLAVTSKDIAGDPMITEEAALSIRATMAKLPWYKLRVFSLFSDKPRYVLAPKGVLLEYLSSEYEKDMLEDAPEFQFVQHVVPVTTYIAAEAITLMERTSDHIAGNQQREAQEFEVKKFSQTMDQDITELLTKEAESKDEGKDDTGKD